MCSGPTERIEPSDIPRALTVWRDAKRTVAICRLLVEDRDDMVVKAMSWALREPGKREPAAAEEFLRKYGPRLAPRVRREVARKLITGTKSGRSTPRGTA